MPKIEQITEEVIKDTPLVAQTIVAVEQAATGMPGAYKREIAIQAVLAGARIAQTAPNRSVASYGLLVDLMVSIFNATGVFGKAKPVAPPALAA